MNAGHDVTVFQRTPQWVFPLPNFAFPEWMRERWARRPERMKIWKRGFQIFIEQFFVKATIGRPVQNFILRNVVRSYLRLGVRDLRLRAKLTPSYGVGCKRIVVNTTFYPGDPETQRPPHHGRDRAHRSGWRADEGRPPARARRARLRHRLS